MHQIQEVHAGHGVQRVLPKLQRSMVCLIDWDCSVAQRERCALLLNATLMLSH